MKDVVVHYPAVLTRSNVVEVYDSVGVFSGVVSNLVCLVYRLSLTFDTRHNDQLRG